MAVHLVSEFSFCLYYYYFFIHNMPFGGPYMCFFIDCSCLDHLSKTAKGASFAFPPGVSFSSHDALCLWQIM